MSNITINLQRIAYLLIILSIGIYMLIVGKPLFVPLAFALMFTFLLLPICQKLERFIAFRPLAILLSMLIAILPIIAAIVLFSYQFITVVKDMPSIGRQLQKGVEEIILFGQRYLGIEEVNTGDWLKDNIGGMLEAPINIVSMGISSSTNVIISSILTFLITFFFMLYRTSFRNFLITQFPGRERKNVNSMIKEVQTILHEYLTGLLLVMFILAVINSLGLWLIGIKYAAFWGILAAFMAIIPYIGTTLGGTLPFVYALATTGTFWQPLAVVILYSSIQTIEGNYITPKVVGSSVSINPLTAILFLFAGGLIWGIAGLVLAIPFAAVLKILFSYITPLKPVSELFSTGLYKNSDKFLNDYDQDEYRISSYFKKKKK
jgi:predicted PurR-regulated permease PerM